MYSMDKRKVAALLDSSAALDRPTVSYSLLSHRILHLFEIPDPTLNFVTTYLSPRTQSVYLNGNYLSSALLTRPKNQPKNMPKSAKIRQR